MAHKFWSVEEEWPGSTVFIVAGGPSVAGQNLELLRGQRVIAINSSYTVVPFADILLFADFRWWDHHKTRKALLDFKGRIVSVSQVAKGGPVLSRLKRAVPPPGYAVERDTVVAQRTSLQGAMNLSGHLGVKKIVLLGADAARAAPDGSLLKNGKPAPGRTHHHEAHPWPNKDGNRSWDSQMAHLQLIVKPLAERGITVVNTSPITRIPWWPKQTLEQVIHGDAGQS